MRGDKNARIEREGGKRERGVVNGTDPDPTRLRVTSQGRTHFDWILGVGGGGC